MYKHEKQAVERLQSNHIHMLPTLSTAIITFFLIISLSGTMLFPMMRLQMSRSRSLKWATRPI